MDATRIPLSRWAILGLLLAIAAGAGLRLIWRLDIEYKFDEEWTFERVQKAGVDEPWPTLGPPTSAGPLNPALNIWVFIGMSKLFGVTDPPGVACVVESMSIAALVLLAFFAIRYVPPPQRELWLWAVALMALNPFAVIYHRKIWQPCLFPLFTSGFLIAWWYRRRPLGAFMAGLIGCLMGQIHLAGWMFAAGFFFWGLLFDRQSLAAWKWCLAGILLGCVPMIPWFEYLAAGPTEPPTGIQQSSVENIWSGKFWFHWITQPLGLTIQYVLGHDFVDFLRYPLIAGHPTYLVGALYLCLAATVSWTAARAVTYLWHERRRIGQILIGRDGPTEFATAACLWGFGIVMTLTAIKIHRHYMLVAMPLIFTWLASIILARPKGVAGVEQGGEIPASDKDPRAMPTALRGHARDATPVWTPGRLCLLALCVIQGLLSASMLGYIHTNQRYINGDFRVPYGAQIQAAGERAERGGE
ncbi:MAG: hypothetical protein U0793_07290 [Gemmataceae bacterium]